MPVRIVVTTRNNKQNQPTDSRAVSEQFRSLSIDDQATKLASSTIKCVYYRITGKRCIPGHITLNIAYETTLKNVALETMRDFRNWIKPGNQADVTYNMAYQVLGCIDIYKSDAQKHTERALEWYKNMQVALNIHGIPKSLQK